MAPLIAALVEGYLIFDDTVLDTRYGEEIELTRRQYSGNEHKVIRGIGLVNCVYVVNPETGAFWVIDYRTPIYSLTLVDVFPLFTYFKIVWFFGTDLLSPYLFTLPKTLAPNMHLPLHYSSRFR